MKIILDFSMCMYREYVPVYSYGLSNGAGSGGGKDLFCGRDHSKTCNICYPNDAGLRSGMGDGQGKGNGGGAINGHGSYFGCGIIY